MKPKKNSFMVKDMAAGGFPSTVWSGDLFECPDCGARIVTGFGKPITGELAQSYDDEAMEFKR
jgi:hypothetical protein